MQLEFAGRGVESREPGLIHHAEPECAVRIDLKIEIAVGITGPRDIIVMLDHRSRLCVHLAEHVLAEIGEPHGSSLVENHVVRLDLLARQVVFGDDDLRRPPVGAINGLGARAG